MAKNNVVSATINDQDLQNQFREYQTQEHPDNQSEAVRQLLKLGLQRHQSKQGFATAILYATLTLLSTVPIFAVTPHLDLLTNNQANGLAATTFAISVILITVYAAHGNIKGDTL